MALVLLSKAKNGQYINRTDTTADTEIQTLINDVSQRAVTYMDRETDYTMATCPADVSDAVCKQVTAEYIYRDSIGTSSKSYQDGSSDKKETDEGWLPEVKAVLDRHRTLYV